ncbi:hypothetical protein OKW36_002061 [Paraburkholderia sp. MM5482-R1]
MSMTQSAASKALQELESMLDAPLFERSKSGMIPNQLGHCVIRYARVVTSDLTALCQDVAEIRSGRGGRLALGAIMGAIPDCVVPALNQLHAAQPALSIEVVEDTSARMLAQLDDGRLDLVVGRAAVAADPSKYQYRPLGDEPLAVVVGYQHVPFAAPRDDVARSRRASLGHVSVTHAAACAARTRDGSRRPRHARQSDFDGFHIRDSCTAAKQRRTRFAAAERNCWAVRAAQDAARRAGQAQIAIADVRHRHAQGRRAVAAGGTVYRAVACTDESANLGAAQSNCSAVRPVAGKNASQKATFFRQGPPETAKPPEKAVCYSCEKSFNISCRFAFCHPTPAGVVAATLSHQSEPMRVSRSELHWFE